MAIVDIEQRQRATARGVDVLGIEYVELYVGNARQAAWFLRLFGFEPVAFRGLETGARETTSWLMRAGDFHVLVTAPLTPEGEVADHVRTHGDGVRDVAFRVPDEEVAYETALALGARGVETEAGPAIAVCGETIHSFVARNGTPLESLDGFVPVEAPREGATATAVEDIDHVTLAVEAGTVDRQVRLYRSVLGFDQMSLAGLASIETDHSAMMSRVVEGGAGKIKIPIVEPSAGKGRSQVDEFLEYYGSPGVQHIGLLTSDVVAAATAIRDVGIQLVDIEPYYYEETAPLIRELGYDVRELQENAVLVDRDEDGYLLQVFTKPVQDRPTFFFELIERHGSRGFGPNNVKHLFRALEHDQRARGNL
ncbi:MAG TPA: 4-hydroxyphenylpyruvate dioxygenase [Gaiellaceae bacterium]